MLKNHTQIIFEHLSDGNFYTKKEIANVTGIKPITVSAIIDRNKDHLDYRKIKTGARGPSPYQYALKNSPGDDFSKILYQYVKEVEENITQLKDKEREGLLNEICNLTEVDGTQELTKIVNEAFKNKFNGSSIKEKAKLLREYINLLEKYFPQSLSK